jgi:hypothetical protein
MIKKNVIIDSLFYTELQTPIGSLLLAGDETHLNIHLF